MSTISNINFGCSHSFECIVSYTKKSLNAISPSNLSKFGLDLYSAYDTTLYPNSKGLIDTDLKIELSKGYYAKIIPPDNLTDTKSVLCVEKIVDKSGNLTCSYINFSNENYNVTKGEKIGKLIIEKLYEIKLRETKSSNNLLEQKNINISHHSNMIDINGQTFYFGDSNYSPGKTKTIISGKNTQIIGNGGSGINCLAF